MDLISDVKVALAIARTKSLSAAARELNMTVPTVSRRLDDLETKLGVRLFNRTTKGVFVTDDGNALLESGQELVEQADDFLRRGALKSKGLTGILRVSAPARFGQLYIAPLVADFLKDHPGLSLDLACTDQILNLEETGFDLAIRIGRFGQDNNIVKKIASNRRILVAAPDWLAANPLPEKIEALAGCDGLMLGSETTWKLKRSHADTGVSRLEITPHVRFRSRYGDVIRSVCEAGCGIALKSVWDVATALQEKTLVQIFPPYEQDSSSDIMMVFPSRRFVSDRVRAFASAVETSLRKTLAGSGNEGPNRRSDRKA